MAPQLNVPVMVVVIVDTKGGIVHQQPKQKEPNLLELAINDVVKVAEAVVVAKVVVLLKWI